MKASRLLWLYLPLLFFLNIYPSPPGTSVEVGDKVAHFLEFAVLGVLSRRLWPYTAPLTVLLEVFQLFVPGRTFSPGDLAANLIGFAAGVLLGWWHEGSHRGTALFNEG